MLEYRKNNYVKDKVIVITGASSGFGAATAKKAAAMGAKVVLVARRSEILEKMVEEMKAAGQEACYIATDIRYQEQCIRMAEFALEKYGRIDVLVNDAGTMPQAFFSEHSWAMSHWEQCIDTAIRGTLYCTCAVYDQMIKQGKGHVINVSSILGNMAVAGNGVYNVSKVGVRFLAESLRAEARGKIKTTVVRPTSVSTTELGMTTVNVNAAMAGMYGKAFQAFTKNAAVYPEIFNRDSIQYGEPTADDLADNIIYAINQPWGVDISDITVRASNEAMYV